ncbi:MAG: histidine--tRNA ligase [Candidatus Izemoplasmatales bacterium]|jgi:histidyl-tRNA synthetase|nr:histidine--tRNA ligase [Candidatus Izemoplasmatales bacterium]MDD4595548.1 histidine--tRNA ligase [Candidatus Izemoplasmatales bacterium]
MITKVKGTYDILPSETRKWQELEAVIFQVSRLYNFKEIRTPIFEASELFHRSVGEASDIVKKETYDFSDRGDRLITLRPEGTAAIVRSVIENKLYADPIQPQKLYYVGPMFRYERPQKGRQRQFHQFGAEALGSYSPALDAEVIAYAITLLKALRIPNVSVKINSLGDSDSKAAYRTELLQYLKPKISELCPDCQARFKVNPLRVLDCKIDKDSPILVNAPKPLDSLSLVAKTHFQGVLSRLDAMGIAYVVDKSLVRGLDYYTHTVFEFEADLPTLGAQATLGGGGRYNDLVKSLDGPDYPAVGFAFGIERLLLALESGEKAPKENYIHAFMIVLGERSQPKAAELLIDLRHGGLIVDTDFLMRPLKTQFKQAERLNAMYIIIFGDDELNNDVVNVKNAKTGVQETIKTIDLYQYIVKGIQNQTSTCSGHCDSCEDEC